MDRRRSRPRSRAAAIIAALVLAALVLAAGCSPATPPVESVAPTAAPSPTPTPTPTPPPTLPPTMAPPPPELVRVEPVGGTTLPIAGRDGAPGLVSCGELPPTTLDEIVATPAGAERRDGPEYDVLRATIARYGDDSEFAFRGQTFREFRVSGSKIVFLGDRGEPEGPFSSIDVELDDTSWRWAGMDGGCSLTGEPGPGWGGVNWTLDPAFNEPTAKTRTLHLLATDYECAGDTRLEGRLSPAWVFLYPKAVVIDLFSVLPPPDAECTDQRPTKVTVRLPEPLGTRELIDGTPTPCRGCGG